MDSQFKLTRDDFARSANPSIRKIVANRFCVEAGGVVDYCFTDKDLTFLSEIKTDDPKYQHVAYAWQQGCAAPVTFALSQLLKKFDLTAPDTQFKTTYHPETGELIAEEINLSLYSSTNVKIATLCGGKTQAKLKLVQPDPSNSPDHFEFQLDSIETDNAFLHDMIMSGRLPDLNSPTYKDAIIFPSLKDHIPPLNDSITGGLKALFTQARAFARDIHDEFSTKRKKISKHPLFAKRKFLAKEMNELIDFIDTTPRKNDMDELIKFVSPHLIKIQKTCPELQESPSFAKQFDEIAKTFNKLSQARKKQYQAAKTAFEHAQQVRTQVSKQSKPRYVLDQTKLCTSENAYIQEKAGNNFYIIPLSQKIFDKDVERNSTIVLSDEKEQEDKTDALRAAWTQECNAVVFNAVNSGLVSAANYFNHFPDEEKTSLRPFANKSNTTMINPSELKATAFEIGFDLYHLLGISPGAEVDLEVKQVSYSDYVRLLLMTLKKLLARHNRYYQHIEDQVDCLISKEVISPTQVQLFCQNQSNIQETHLEIISKLTEIENLTGEATYPVFQIQQIRTDSTFVHDTLMRAHLPDVTARKYQHEIYSLAKTSEEKATSVKMKSAIREASVPLKEYTLTPTQLRASTNPKIQELVRDKFYTQPVKDAFERDFKRSTLVVIRHGEQLNLEEIQREKDIYSTLNSFYAQSLLSIASFSLMATLGIELNEAVTGCQTTPLKGIIDISNPEHITLRVTEMGLTAQAPSSSRELTVDNAVTTEFELDNKLGKFKFTSIKTKGRYMHDVLMSKTLPDVTRYAYRREISGTLVTQAIDGKINVLNEICSKEIARLGAEIAKVSTSSKYLSLVREKDEKLNERATNVAMIAEDLGLPYLLKTDDQTKKTAREVREGESYVGDFAAKRFADNNTEFRRTVRKYEMWRQLQAALTNDQQPSATALKVFSTKFHFFEKKLNARRDTFGIQICKTIGAIIGTALCIVPAIFSPKIRNQIHRFWYTKSEDQTTAVKTTLQSRKIKM